MPPHCRGSMLLINLSGEHSGKPKSEFKMTGQTRPAFRLGCERLEPHTTLIGDGNEKEKMEPGLSGWNLPSFPVHKANG